MWEEINITESLLYILFEITIMGQTPGKKKEINSGAGSEICMKE